MLNRKIKVTFYLGLGIYLLFAIVPRSIAEEKINYEILLAETDTDEVTYEDDSDYEDYEDDEDEDDEDLKEYADEENVEDEDEDKEEVPQKKAQAPKVNKVAPLIVKKVTKEKGRFRRLKRDCNMRSIASVSGEKVGMAKKKKKLWTEPAGDKWIQVQRKSGPAYISRKCF